MYLIQNFINRMEDLHARIKHVTKFNKIVIQYYFKAYFRQSVALRAQKVGMGDPHPHPNFLRPESYSSTARQW